MVDDVIVVTGVKLERLSVARSSFLCEGENELTDEDSLQSYDLIGAVHRSFLELECWAEEV